MVFTKKATDSIFIVIPIWVNRLKGIIFLPILVNSIGMEAYGVYVQILTNVLVLTPVIHFALGQSLLRYTSSVPDENLAEIGEALRGVLLFCLLASFVVSIGYLVFIPVISQYLMDEMYLKELYAAVPLISIAGLMAILFPYLNSRKRFKESSIFRLLYEMLPYVGFIIVVYAWESLFWGFVAYSCIGILVLLAILFRIRAELFGGSGINGAKLKAYLIFSWPIAVNNLSSAGVEAIPKYFISAIMGPSMLGGYNIMLTVINAITTVSEPLLQYLNSHLPKIWDEGLHERVYDLLDRCTIYYICAMTACGVLVVLTFEDLVSVLFSESQISIMEQASFVMGVLSVFGILFGLNKFSHITAKLMERPRVVLSSSIIGFVVTVPSAYLLIRHYGLLGAALSQAIAALVMQAMFRYQLGQPISMVFLRKSLKIFLPMVASGIVVVSITGPSVWQLTIAAVLGIASFSLAAHMAGVVRFDEIHSLIVDRRTGNQSGKCQ